MKPEERKKLGTLLAGVYSLYSKDLTAALLSIWAEAMKPYEFDVIQDALNRHAVNPDNGQWCPKPADIVKLIDGGSEDAALIAWAKVERAVSSAGAWATVIFDDAIIHAVICDMGGWPELCRVELKELPFRAKEFATRYRGYRLRGPAGFQHVPTLPGLHDMNNAMGGHRQTVPLLFGNREAAIEVFRLGSKSESTQHLGTMLEDLTAARK